MADSTVLVDQHGKPLKVNGHSKPRQELVDAFRAVNVPRRSNQSYDSARTNDDNRRHWANADGLDADSSNNRAVRTNLIHRSRYECGSNGIYAGIIETHVNMVVGVGPTLRMLTKNRNFNQFVEREFYRWTQRILWNEKLRCMSHAKTQDGESFGILINNPRIEGEVQLDVILIEAEQCHTPYLPFREPGYVDGIRFDPETDEKLWYDILPEHPGSSNQSTMAQKPLRVLANEVLHWLKVDRPGQHRGVPAMTSTLNVGASSRRWREATLAAAETAADFTLFLKTQFTPEILDQVAPLSTLEISKRMMTALPNSMEPFQLKAEHPTSSYEGFNRSLTSEMASPITQPYNVASHDSSTYSFASGKLDTLCYRAAIDVERQECNDRVLDPLFKAWFAEWVIVSGNRGQVPDHQWDWPIHPVIDAVAEASATDTKLKNGTITLRQVYSDNGQDLEDQLSVMAEDYFGEASDENILQMRQILLRTHYPAAAPAESSAPKKEPQAQFSHAQLRQLKSQLDSLEESVR